MDNRIPVNPIWKYFMEYAEEIGRMKNGNQSPSFSMHWAYKYYCNVNNRFNPLAKVFLYESDLTDLNWNETLNINIDDYLVEPGPNDDQKEAIKMALTMPVSFIQGPPGTGKSRSILNIMSAAAVGLGKTVLMVSQNNSAIGVVADKITESYSAAGMAGENISGTIRRNRQELHRQFAKLGSMERMKEYNDAHNDFEFARKKFGEFKDLDVKVESQVRFDDFTRSHKVMTSTLHSLKRLFMDGDGEKPSGGPNVQYDYVIIDESSQVSPILGLLALTSAKHLVVVGDEEQLAPIINTENAEHINNNFGLEVPENYIIDDRNDGNPPSILDMLLYRFLLPNGSNKILLRSHYRCHPGIIGFNNRHVYGSRLIIRTDCNHIDTRDYKVPIKVLWYQGDYCEKTLMNYDPEDVEDDYSTEDDGNANAIATAADVSKRNGKQVEIFIKEELPKLLASVLDENDNTIDGFSILSPFRGVLKELGERVAQYIADNNIDPGGMIDVLVNSGNQESENGHISFPIISVTKSQGREYDVVYFLPAEDSKWEKPWSQSKSLINVAASRAREELRIIVSTSLMSEEMQRALLGSVNVIPESARVSDNFRYVQKLIDYVKEANENPVLPGIPFDFPESNLTGRWDFGFHEAGNKSVFDAVSVIRRDAPVVREDKESFLLCMIQSIINMDCFVNNGMNLYTDVMLSDFVDANEHPIMSRENIWEALAREGHFISEEQMAREEQLMLHVDLVVCDNDKNVLLMIEVDGEMHRYNRDKRELKDQQLRDGVKDQIINDYFGSDIFERFRTDGTSCGESKIIEDYLNRRPAKVVKVKSKSLASCRNLYPGITPQALQAELTNGNRVYLTRRPMWSMHSDGKSWILEGTQNEYAIPTQLGESFGIVRHYGINGVVYMNPEYLERAEHIIVEAADRIRQAEANGASATQE